MKLRAFCIIQLLALYYFCIMLADMSKMLRFLLPILAVAISSPQIAHAAKDTLRLKPSSKWIMRHEDDSCRLVRLFGEGDDKMMLVLTRFGPGSKFRMTVAGKPVKTTYSTRPLKIQFGDYEAQQEIDYSVGTAGGLPALIAHRPVRISGPTKGKKQKRITKKQYAAAEYMRIRVGGKRPVHLETGSLAGPFDAMNTCVKKMMTDWGIDIGKHKTRSEKVRPIGKPEDWVRSKDYPLEMLNKRQPGLVHFRLSVDENGKATACHIQQATRPQGFDDAVCEGLIKRSSFTPALDADGKPMASYWRSQVRFAINN